MAGFLNLSKPAESGTIAEVPRGVIEAAAPLSTALANAIATFVNAGHLDEAKELKKELLQLSKSLTWLMREDRHEQASRRAK